jgi:hypothetical protein
MPEEKRKHPLTQWLSQTNGRLNDILHRRKKNTQGDAEVSTPLHPLTSSPQPLEPTASTENATESQPSESDPFPQESDSEGYANKVIGVDVSHPEEYLTGPNTASQLSHQRPSPALPTPMHHASPILEPSLARPHQRSVSAGQLHATTTTPLKQADKAAGPASESHHIVDKVHQTSDTVPVLQSPRSSTFSPMPGVSALKIRETQGNEENELDEDGKEDTGYTEFGIYREDEDVDRKKHEDAWIVRIIPQ